MTRIGAPDLDRSADRLSITHVTTPAPMGGLETVIAGLTAGLAERGHRVRVIAFMGEGEECPPFARLPALGVELLTVRVPPRSYRVEIDHLDEALRTIGPTVVHSHGYHADLIAWRSARAARRPLVSTVHGFVAGGWKNRAYEWLDRRLLRRFDAVVAVSRPLRDQLVGAGIAPTRVELIVNSLREAKAPLSRSDARRLLGIPPEGAVCGWVGRLSPEKGPDVFLEAVSRLPSDWSASLVGDGPWRGQLGASSIATAVASRVRWHGAVADAGRLVTAFDAVVLSSRTEGTPMIAMEAMAAKVPLVVTAVGGIPDLVSPGEALLVRPEDPTNLAAAIDRIRIEPAEAAARAERAADRLASQFGPSEWIDRHERLYRRLIGSTQ